MAGYLIAFDSFESLKKCVEAGVYAARISGPTKSRSNNYYWRQEGLGPFGDYASMKEDDDLYFFSKRNIYGIGRVVNVGYDCKYLNYPGSLLPKKFKYATIKNDLLYDFGSKSSVNRVICTFEPNPHVFLDGVDMDDLLKSGPSRFKVLRFWSGLSFLRFGDEESKAFKDIILKTNLGPSLKLKSLNAFKSKSTTVHSSLKVKSQTTPYKFSLAPLLDLATKSNGKIGSESLIESALISQISAQDPDSKLGKWDYVSRQVPASPPKAPAYIDKMDLFGSSYIQGQPTIGRFYVGELKADKVVDTDLLQLMKYVDWLRDEYASGDYSMIRAFLIGFRFKSDLKSRLKALVERNYVRGSRERVKNEPWHEVTLLKYRYDSSKKKLVLEAV